MIRYERDGERWIAYADARVGVARTRIRIELGALPREPDPGGLRAVPVVVVGSPSIAVARAGATRAGKAPSIRTLPGDAPSLGGRFLVAVQEGIDVILVEDGDAQALTTARALAGTPILPASDDLRPLLAVLTVDVTVAVPTREAAAMEPLAGAATADGRQWWHHPIAVDPGPAFEEIGRDPATAIGAELAAAAAGVLAGRLAAGNRRWRAG